MAKNVYSERFLSIVDKTGICDAKIADSVNGLDKTLMSHIRTGRQGASLNVLSSFCEAYPEVNANYILTGKGEMFLSEDNKPVDNLSTSQSQDLYESIIIGKDKEIEELKNEINRLIGENSIMREQLGIGKRKPSTKSA